MFETSLEEASKYGSGRRWLSVPLSILVHAGLLGGALAASAWFVEDPEEPPGRVVFGRFLPQPPAGPVERLPGGRPPEARSAQASPSSQPSAVPASLPVASKAPEAPASPGSPGTDRSGTPGEIPGDDGTRPSIGGPTGSRTAREEPQTIYTLEDDRVLAPVEISRVQPDYPESARKARMQGTVVIEAVISRFGTVESVRILRSVSPLLDASATKAVSRWRYEPARFDGRPVPVYLTVTVRFQLE
jgi:protein TonB